MGCRTLQVTGKNPFANLGQPMQILTTEPLEMRTHARGDSALIPWVAPPAGTAGNQACRTIKPARGSAPDDPAGIGVVPKDRQTECSPHRCPGRGTGAHGPGGAGRR